MCSHSSRSHRPWRPAVAAMVRHCSAISRHLVLATASVVSPLFFSASSALRRYSSAFDSIRRQSAYGRRGSRKRGDREYQKKIIGTAKRKDGQPGGPTPCAICLAIVASNSRLSDKALVLRITVSCMDASDAAVARLMRAYTSTFVWNSFNKADRVAILAPFSQAGARLSLSHRRLQA